LLKNSPCASTGEFFNKIGTNRTFSDVRSSVAIGRKADMAFAQADFRN